MVEDARLIETQSDVSILHSYCSKATHAQTIRRSEHAPAATSLSMHIL